MGQVLGARASVVFAASRIIQTKPECESRGEHRESKIKETSAKMKTQVYTGFEEGIQDNNGADPNASKR